MYVNLAGEKLLVMHMCMLDFVNFKGLLPQSPITENYKMMYRVFILVCLFG